MAIPNTPMANNAIEIKISFIENQLGSKDTDLLLMSTKEIAKKTRP